MDNERTVKFAGGVPHVMVRGEGHFVGQVSAGDSEWTVKFSHEVPIVMVRG